LPGKKTHDQAFSTSPKAHGFAHRLKEIAAKLLFSHLWQACSVNKPLPGK
jgi:hypothetical protein